MVEKAENGLSYGANVHLLSKNSVLGNLVLVTFLFLCFFALISGASAAHFNSSSTNSEIQAFLSNTSAGDNEVVFEGGTYNQITGLTVGRSVNISSSGQVNIKSPSAGTLFTITASNVRIVNLNISAYNLAINSNQGNLSVIGCNMSTIDRSIHLSGASLTGVLLENNTIISSVNSTLYGAVYVSATAGSVVNIVVKGNNILGNGTSNSMGVRFNVVRCNNTLFFENNNITGTYGVFLGAYTNCNNTMTITSNNITGTSRGVYLGADTYSNNTINITNNNITGTSNYGVFLNASTNSNNTITITNNNITGTSASSVYLYAHTNSNNTITITNNNITGISNYGVFLNAYTSNNNITITNNNITGISNYGVDLEVYTNSNNTITITSNNITGTSRGVYLYAHINSNNTITITNNNITGTGTYGVFLGAYTYSNNTIIITNNNITGTYYSGVYLAANINSNNTITITSNNITGTSNYGVYLGAYASNNTISFTGNNIMGASYGMYVNCNNQGFSGLSVVNNTLNATDSGGIGIGFVNLNRAGLSDILVSGNNIFAGTTGGTGISFGTGLVSVDNVTINYNRVLAVTGLSIPTTTIGSVNANLNWWGNNTPRIIGMTLDNWFVMELSANTFWTIVNASVNQSGLVNLTYKFLLFTNSSNSTGVVGFANLPHFLVDIFWNNTSGNLYNRTGVDAFGTYSYTVTPGNYTLNSIGDWSDVRLDITTVKLNTSSTIVVPDEVRTGKTVNITGVATDENGNPLANVDLAVIVDGKTYTLTTDNNGRWILAYKPTHTGNIDVSVSWAGNSTHFGFTNTTTFKVKKGNIIVTIKLTENPDGSVTITANATDEDGDPVSDYPVDFILDGKTVGHGTTDKDGIASITIPASKLSDGPHTITVIVIGGDNHNDGIASIEFTTKNNETNNTNKTNNNPAPAKAAAMKNTGIPIIILLILTVLGLTTYRRR